MRQLNLEQALSAPPIELVTMQLLKAVQEGDTWKFAGIASDEGSDVEGDAILKKALDVSYAQQRGYVNWDHSRDPEAQIGYLTQCSIIEKDQIPGLEARLGIPLAKSASIYVEGNLYPHVDQAIKVQKIMKSVDGSVPALGLSLDGAMARATGGDVVKAFVRGVAITPVPAHPMTMIRLRKSIKDAQLESKEGTTMVQENPDLAAQVRQLVLLELAKAANKEPTLSYDDAVMWVLKQRPAWSYDLATKLVKFTVQSTARG